MDVHMKGHSSAFPDLLPYGFLSFLITGSQEVLSTYPSPLEYHIFSFFSLTIRLQKISRVQENFCFQPWVLNTLEASATTPSAARP